MGKREISVVVNYPKGEDELKELELYLDVYTNWAHGDAYKAI
ncbi:hypothetical protein [Clostridium sp. ZS2-4]|nr:hypothetical protein [Clostridium sp. ZS2-4]MCY6354983.1 hypothetical protein [Clostridium sp. ZS2-4]